MVKEISPEDLLNCHPEFFKEEAIHYLEGLKKAGYEFSFYSEEEVEEIKDDFREELAMAGARCRELKDKLYYKDDKLRSLTDRYEVSVNLISEKNDEIEYLKDRLFAFGVSMGVMALCFFMFIIAVLSRCQ